MTDVLNIQGEDIPDIDPNLDKLLVNGLTQEVRILDGASAQVFGNKQPYAVTDVKIEFTDENDLRNCVRLLRWSDERLLAMGSSIVWAWNFTTRQGMTIKFAVNWYDKNFFDRRKNAVTDKNHLSYFAMFGKSAADMDIQTRII